MPSQKRVPRSARLVWLCDDDNAPIKHQIRIRLTTLLSMFEIFSIESFGSIVEDLAFYPPEPRMVSMKFKTSFAQSYMPM